MQQFYPVDMAIFTSEGFKEPMEAVALDYPDVQFVLNTEIALDYIPNKPNVNVLWATLYEAR